MPVTVITTVAFVTVCVQLVLFVGDQLSSEPQGAIVGSYRVDNVLVHQVTLGRVRLPIGLFWSHL